MNNLHTVFADGKAFIPFITCGDPDLETTERLIYELENAGADLIELGIPFSDPTAEGPTIQAANARALAQGITTDDVFALVTKVRETSSVPLAIMTYANVVFSYGINRFMAQAARAGISALILADVPYEEKNEFAIACKVAGISYISLVAPTSNERIARIASAAEGFVYCVSSLGVTGTRSSLSSNIEDVVSQVREHTETPCAIGFGISTPEQAAQMARIANGVIVGSALVELCGRYGRDCVGPVAQLASEMVQAISSLKDQR